jgi:5'-nucleotidase
MSDKQSSTLVSARRPTILIDQDGPLANWESELLKRWKETYPNSPCVELRDRKDFYAARDYQDLAGTEAEKEEMARKVQSIYLAKGFIQDLPVVDGAINAVRSMLELGYDVRICTSPLTHYRNCVLEKFEWVEKHFGFEFTKKIIMCKEKEFVRGDFLIDDRPDIGGESGITPGWEHILFDAPYNRQVPGKKRLKRWDDWKEVLQLSRLN